MTDDYDPQADSIGSARKEVVQHQLGNRPKLQPDNATPPVTDAGGGPEEWRVIVYGVWPNLKPSGNPDHVFDQCFPTEGLARQCFIAWQGRATLYRLDSSMGELGRCAMEQKP